MLNIEDVRINKPYSTVFQSELYHINSEIKSHLSTFREGKLKEASVYSSIDTGGKRIRPILFLETIKLFEKDYKPLLPIAAAIELSHIYSLIHDDLPALDNDDYRREKPSCHKKFNESTAILTGDALLTHAFEIISNASAISHEKRCLLISEFAKSLGQEGMVGGQMLDMELQNLSYSEDVLIKLHSLKTGKLITFCISAAAVICDASKEEKASLHKFGTNFGLIFQITDDLLDYDEKESSECNIVNAIGISETKLLLKKLVNEVILSLDIFGNRANILKSLVEHMLHREK
ncbi:MAG: polyprenyl synthetase family protein [Alphaproteobacteria bacterium]|nr:polyprenyl synthetase family protein [Alphaproteobacteria bacterium]